MLVKTQVFEKPVQRVQVVPRERLSSLIIAEAANKKGTCPGVLVANPSPYQLQKIHSPARRSLHDQQQPILLSDSNLPAHTCNQENATVIEAQVDREVTNTLQA